MDCHEAQRLLHGYVDGELDLVTSLGVERHLQECPGCAAAQARLQAVRVAVRSGAPVFTPPPNLERRIRSTVLKANPVARVPQEFRWGRLAVAASVALALAAGGRSPTSLPAARRRSWSPRDWSRAMSVPK